MQNIIIIGASGHAKVIIDIIEKQGKYRVLGIIDAILQKGATFFDYPVLGDDNMLPGILSEKPGCKLFIAIGDNWRRSEVYKKIDLLIPDAEYACVIHPSAQIGRGVALGRGVAVMAGAIVNSDTIIGDFAVLNTQCSIDHDNIIRSFASYGPGAISGGNVSVGEYSAVAIGAVLRHGVTIGCHTLVGASALVTADIEDLCVAYGVPATIVRKRNIGDAYL